MLPASDEAFSVGIEEPSITLQQALRNDQIQYSTFATQVLAVFIFHQCLDLSMSSSSSFESPEVQDATFWAQYQELDTGLSSSFLNLPDHLKFTQNAYDKQSVLANLRLHTASICLHRAGAARMKMHGDGNATLLNSQTRLFLAAEDIFAIVALLVDIDAQFRNPFVTFAAFMAASVFLDDYTTTQKKQSEDRFGALLDLMIVVGESNSMCASLAVQLAHQSFRAGVDQNAIQKVRRPSLRILEDS